MAKQKPPNPAGRLTGFPYSYCWEEYGPPGEPLYADGAQRVIIERSFKWAREHGEAHLWIRKADLDSLLRPLALDSGRRRDLARELYYLAGHYLGPEIRKLRDDSPAQVRHKMVRISKTSAKLEELISTFSPAVQRHLRGARWMLGPSQRTGNPEITWPELRNQLSDLARAAQIIVDEFPRMSRGTTMKLLQGRWLRQSATAIEKAAGAKITTKTSNAEGKNYRFEGIEGGVFEAYGRRVDEKLALVTMVQAVRSLHRSEKAKEALLTGRAPGSRSRKQRRQSSTDAKVKDARDHAHARAGTH